MTALAAAAALVAGPGASLRQYGPSEPISQYGGLHVCVGLKLSLQRKGDGSGADYLARHYDFPDHPPMPTGTSPVLVVGQLVSGDLDGKETSLKIVSFVKGAKACGIVTTPTVSPGSSTASGPKSQTMDRESEQPVVKQEVVVSESDRKNKTYCDNCGDCYCDPCPTAPGPIFGGRTVDSGRQGIDSRQADECDLITGWYSWWCCKYPTEEVVKGCKDGCASCKCPSCGPCPTVEGVQAALSGVPAQVASAAGELQAKFPVKLEECANCSCGSWCPGTSADVVSATEQGISCCQSGASLTGACCYNAGAYCCSNCLQCKCCGCCAGCCSDDCCAGCDGCDGCDGGCC